MVIISENKARILTHFRSNYFRYAVIYVIGTFFVLLFLNIYSLETSQKLFYNSKKETMIEKCITASTRISNLEVITKSSVSEAISDLTGQKTTRIIVTDDYGVAIYDTIDDDSAAGKYILLPELVTAMEGNDVFCWSYDDGVMQSRSATPITSKGILVGCVYMAESDATQGALIQSLRQNIFVLSLALELAVIIFSLSFSRACKTS